MPCIIKTPCYYLTIYFFSLKAPIRPVLILKKTYVFESIFQGLSILPDFKV